METTETAPVKRTAAEMIAAMRQPEEYFDVPFAGTVVKVRAVRDVPTMVSLKKRAARLARKTKETVPDEWKPYFPIDEETANMVVELATLAVEPAFSDLEALQMAHECGPALAWFHSHLMIRMASTVVQAETEALDDLGEDSGETLSIGLSSPSPVTSTTSTPTN